MIDDKTMEKLNLMKQLYGQSPEFYSDCCQDELIVGRGDGNRRFYICKKCAHLCNSMEQNMSK